MLLLALPPPPAGIHQVCSAGLGPGLGKAPQQTSTPVLGSEGRTFF